MKLPIYQVDAFTSKVFGGNPAAVCILNEWLDAPIMQKIAAENNLAETAFIVPKDDHFTIRWFTPTLEVDLCGHATLASAYVLFMLGLAKGEVTFQSMSGQLAVKQLEDDLLALDFPARKPVVCEKPALLEDALGVAVKATLASRDLLVVLDREEQVVKLKPNFEILSSIKEHFAIIVSAPGDKVDFVSRFFAPNAGILEDPVTGSAHCTLIPYWSELLGKNNLHALQVSPRGGELFCANLDERVSIAGAAVLYLKGEIYL